MSMGGLEEFEDGYGFGLAMSGGMLQSECAWLC